MEILIIWIILLLYFVWFLKLLDNQKKLADHFLHLLEILRKNNQKEIDEIMREIKVKSTKIH